MDTHVIHLDPDVFDAIVRARLQEQGVDTSRLGAPLDDTLTIGNTTFRRKKG